MHLMSPHSLQSPLLFNTGKSSFSIQPGASFSYIMAGIALLLAACLLSFPSSTWQVCEECQLNNGRQEITKNNFVWLSLESSDSTGARFDTSLPQVFSVINCTLLNKRPIAISPQECNYHFKVKVSVSLPVVKLSRGARSIATGATNK